MENIPIENKKDNLFDADFNLTAYGRKKRSEVTVEQLEKEKEKEKDKEMLGPLFKYVYDTSNFIINEIKKA